MLAVRGDQRCHGSARHHCAVAGLRLGLPSIGRSSVRTPVAEELIARGLAALGRQAVDDGRAPEPCLRHYLADHIAAGYAWDILDNVELLDELIPSAVASVAWRAQGRIDLNEHPALAVALVAHKDLAALRDPEARQLTWALAAARLGVESPGLRARGLLWARLARVAPHIVLTGHTDAVASIAFSARPYGALLPATSSEDSTVRLWAVDGVMALGFGQFDIRPSVPTSVCIVGDLIYVGCNDRLMALSVHTDSTTREAYR